MPSMWTKLVNLVIRPPRAEYDPERHLPGPRFKLGGVPCHRTDLELTGALGLRLKCSHYRREDFRDKTEPSPCVIYLHGNSGSRCDATRSSTPGTSTSDANSVKAGSLPADSYSSAAGGSTAATLMYE